MHGPNLASWLLGTAGTVALVFGLLMLLFCLVSMCQDVRLYQPFLWTLQRHKTLIKCATALVLLGSLYLIILLHN